jgi:glutathione S-transferase
MHFAEGSAMLPLMLALYTSRLGQAAAPLLPRIESELANHFDYMEGALADRKFFAGSDFTAADVQMSFVLEAADGSGRLEAYPRLKDLISRYRERPAYKRAIEKGGPLELTRR